MKVELIAHTPDPDTVVAVAARICYSDKGVSELRRGFNKEEVASFLMKLVSSGHFSPVEHASFTFAIEGVSRALSHQLVRHRIASYSQKSQRYVDENNFIYITPPSVASNPEALSLFQSTMEEIQQCYHKLSQVVPREDARYILPNAVETKLVCTFNARSLLNFFRLRCCRRAQWEIRELAFKMREEVRRVAPMLFSLAGPSCETEGICWEGDLTCGKAREVRKREVPVSERNNMGT